MALLNINKTDITIPKDIGGIMHINIYGREDFYVENFKCIINFSECEMIIKGKISNNYIGNLCIYGSKFYIVFFDEIGMRVRGKIDEIRYS